MNKAKRKAQLEKIAHQAKLDEIVKEAQQATTVAPGGNLGESVFNKLLERITNEIVDDLLDDSKIPD